MILSQQMLPRKQAFTLIELLTVIAIVGILTAILIPTVGRVQETARRTVDQSNIRQIGQASLIFANENDSRLPTVDLLYDEGPPGSYALTGGAGSVSVHDVAAVLAITGGLNDATMWVSRSDVNLTTPPTTPGPIVLADRSFAPGFDGSELSIDYIVGLNTAFPPSTPIAFTRGLQTDGTWDAAGTYGLDGGHIVFIGGNVSFFRDVGTFDSTATPPVSSNGRLVNAYTGEATANIAQAMPAGSEVVGIGTMGSLDGTPSAP